MAEAPPRIGSKSKAAQGIPLLTTKLYIPPARPGPVPRPRLTDRLNEGLDRRMALISAPAGYGKTTLLSEWRSAPPASDLPMAWVSLDEGDNDPVRFWAYIIAGLQRIQEGVGEPSLSAFQSPQPPLMEPVLTALINDLTTISDDFVLVLDDYHHISAESGILSNVVDQPLRRRSSWVRQRSLTDPHLLAERRLAPHP